MRWIDKNIGLFYSLNFIQMRPKDLPSRAVHLIDDIGELEMSERSAYSRMKYGDGKAVKYWGGRLDTLLRPAICRDGVLLTTLPSKVLIPIVSVIEEVQASLRGRGISVGRFNFDQHGSIHSDPTLWNKNYGSLNGEERARAIALKKPFISPEREHEVQGQTVIFIDDLRATGSTAKLYEAVLASSNAAAFGMYFLIEFSG